MGRRDEIMRLTETIAADAKTAIRSNSDSAWLLACNRINGYAAELVKLTRSEACAIVDAKMRA